MTDTGRPTVTFDPGGVVLVPTPRLADTIYAICRDCGQEWSRYEDGGRYWPIGHSIAMHCHKREDGRWEKSGGVKRAWLYRFPARCDTVERQ